MATCTATVPCSPASVCSPPQVRSHALGQVGKCVQAEARHQPLVLRAGAAAALAWEDVIQNTGIQLAFLDSSTGQWRVERGTEKWQVGSSSADHWTNPATHGVADKGFSASGRRLASLYWRYIGTGLPGMGAQLYDTQERRWLPEQVVDERRGVVCEGRASFSDCEKLAAAAYRVQEPESCLCLAVFGDPEQPVRRVTLTADKHAWAWLPGSTSLLVKCGSSLARVDFGSKTAEPIQEVQPQWVQSGDYLHQSAVCLALLPGSQAAATLHCVRTNVGGLGEVTAELALHSTESLARLSFTQLELHSRSDLGVASLCTSLHTSQRFVAACFDSQSTSVWELADPLTIGRRLYHADGLSGPSLSPSGGHFLAGCMRDTVCVWEARTGDCLAVTPAPAWASAPAPEGFQLWPSSVGWDQPNGGRLHIVASLLREETGSKGVAFMTLQF